MHDLPQTAALPAQAGPILPSPAGICRERLGPTTAPKQRDLLRPPRPPGEDEEEDLVPRHPRRASTVPAEQGGLARSRGAKDAPPVN